MKKFLTIIALLMAFVTPGLANKTVYLDATPSGNVNWPSGARLALYMFKGSENAWKDFELKAGETYIYQATVPDEYTHIICVRMNGSTTENNWDNKWNQTQDIDISNFTEFINVKITGWDAASYSGPSTAAEISSVVLKGSYDSWGSGTALTEGTGNTWTGVLDLTDVTTNVDIKLLANTDGWVSFSDLTLDLGDNITLTQNGSNYSLNNATSGFKTYTITATWTEGPSAALGWTLKIAGKDERLVTENWTCTAGSVEALAYDLTDETAKVAIGEEQVEVTLNIKGSDFLIKGTKSGNTVTFAKGQECNVPIEESMMTVQAYGPSDGDITFTYSEVGDNKILTQNGIITLKAGVYAVATITGVVIESNPAPAFPGTVIWSSETPVEAVWSKDDIRVDATTFASAKIGDLIYVAVEGVTPGGKYDAQVALKDGAWTDLEGAIPVGLGDKDRVSFTITGDILSWIQKNGMIISGEGYSTRKVTLAEGSLTGSEMSVWIGNSTGKVVISNNHLKNANNKAGIKAGDIIRVTATEREGYTGDKWMVASYSGEDTSWNWVDYSDMNASPITGGFDFVVPESNVAELKTDGIIVNQSGYNVTQVEIITPNGDYYIINDLGQGWVVGDKMVEDNGVYSATIEDAAGKYFAIVPNTGLNAACDALVSWANVARPVSVGNFLVQFRNYAGTNNIIYTGNNVWAVEASNDADVTINFTPASNSFTLSCEKTITMAAGYATYSNDQKFQVTGAEAYKVTAANGTSATLTKIDVDDPVFAGGKYTKGTGIILKGTSAVIKSVDADAEVTAATDENNMMVGSGDETYIISGYAQELGSYTPYILMDGSNGVGFYKFVITGDTTEDEKKLAPHKAFLAAPENLAPFLSFDDEGGTTGISNVNVNHNDNQWYDLSGRRVENPTKGLYIMNGKKVIIK